MANSRAAALCAALILSACAFSSEAPLFFARDAAHPFEDGARFLWRESGSSETPRFVTYRRDGALYRLHSDRDGEEPMETLFVAIRSTPQEDYIAQVRLRPDDGEDARAYAYVWREGDDYLIFASPSAIDELPGGADARTRFCVTLSYGECQFRSREAALRLYRDVIWPYVVKAKRERDGLIVQSPVATGSPT